MGAWRFCATVLNGFEKPARQELLEQLQPWAPLSLHSTKVGRIFFTLGALRYGDSRSHLASGLSRFCVMR